MPSSSMVSRCGYIRSVTQSSVRLLPSIGLKFTTSVVVAMVSVVAAGTGAAGASRAAPGRWGRTR